MPGNEAEKQRTPACEQMVHNALEDFERVVKANPTPESPTQLLLRASLVTFTESLNIPSFKTEAEKNLADVKSGITQQINALNNALTHNQRGFDNLITLIAYANIPAPDRLLENATNATQVRIALTEALLYQLRQNLQNRCQNQENIHLKHDTYLLQTLVDLCDTRESASAKVLFNGLTEYSDAVKALNINPAALEELKELAETKGIDGLIDRLDNDPDKGGHIKILGARFDVQAQPGGYEIYNKGQESQTNALIALTDCLNHATLDMTDDNTVKITFDDDAPENAFETVEAYLDGMMGSDAVKLENSQSAQQTLKHN